MIEREAKRFIELIPNSVCTIFTRTCEIIPQIPRTSIFKEPSHILPTTLPTGGLKPIEFQLRALHNPIMQLRRHHPPYQPCERDELVQPHAPEIRDLRFRNGDAAEEGEDDDDKGIEECRDQC